MSVCSLQPSFKNSLPWTLVLSPGLPGCPLTCSSNKKLSYVEHRPHVFHSVSPLVDMINCVCSIYAIPFGSEGEVNWDSRPYVVGNFNGINVKCSIDTGASVSCLSRESYQSIPGYQALESVPIQPCFWISAQ